METLAQDTVFEILLHLSGADLLTFCATNRAIASFCDEQNEYFWQLKVLNDYGDRNISNKPNNLSWKRFYLLIGTNFMKQIPLTYLISTSSVINPTTPPQLVPLGSIWINRDDIPEQILQRANKLFTAQYPNDNPRELILRGNNIDMFWLNPLSNSQLFNVRPNFYDLANQLIYSLSGGIKHLIQGKAGVIRLAMIGQRS